MSSIGRSLADKGVTESTHREIRIPVQEIIFDLMANQGGSKVKVGHK